MAKRLFVGGIPWSLTDATLADLFGKIGKVTSAKIIVDKFTQQSKGFAFVEFENDADADKAIKELSDTEVEGRKIVVQEARPLEERAPRRDFGGDRRSGGGFGGGDRRGGRGGFSRGGGGRW
ncbi:RNA-binding protein [Candidatus Woesebacteria bacterium CG22_combo_CG10-13_8_21_14_all_39_10]|uniref:RNA-binding protein n=4 Tax=Candidatus Woeseibacteriota TaxID=1752722 RepID=A0A2M7XAC0_9BACT|nr:MAG: RNA-binding protein [Candidatus Woesebacteria bacterium CG22_combo_CG10-13_8_21_14_all_39_10]PIU71798.1 MAG: RNA-binding protein [Candidatus Woesebacteria bacterium CG06_land_8_20_14_3_00_39_27]PIZ47082.1 MAG: RNA-binding protein [Candidatus Woesebacteria bacterium CG_4_10_14_0_2_um_filter_39_14]PJA43102.1 MAG: RNA-binding protein [Candidatus Woesebacteria bacterium CG_4_9_14_3_um_filter_39_10]